MFPLSYFIQVQDTETHFADTVEQRKDALTVPMC